MSDESSPRKPAKGEAPVMPGGEPELAGTGPQGAVKPAEGNVSPEDVPDRDEN